MAGTFFLPFGFDWLLLVAMKLMGGYWNAICLFYCLVALFVGLYIYSRKNTFLAISLFINPFGYDALFAYTMHVTGAFWKANLIFYSIALMFFSVYFYIHKKNPIKDALAFFNEILQRTRQLFFRRG